jgi:hypothetical protein
MRGSGVRIPLAAPLQRRRLNDYPGLRAARAEAACNGNISAKPARHAEAFLTLAACANSIPSTEQVRTRGSPSCGMVKPWCSAAGVYNYRKSNGLPRTIISPAWMDGANRGSRIPDSRSFGASGPDFSTSPRRSRSSRTWCLSRCPSWSQRR